MQNTGAVSQIAEVTDKVEFRSRKSMKARNLGRSQNLTACFLN